MAVRWRLGVVLQIVSGAEKRALIEVAPFGRLDQVLRTAVHGCGLEGLCPLLGGLEGGAPQPKSKNFQNLSKKFEKQLTSDGFLKLLKVRTTLQHGN